MDSALAGLIGAGIGAFASLVGTLVAHILQSRRENKERILDRREAAYSNSLRYLLKVLNRRSKVTSEGEAVLGIDSVSQWLDDLSEAQIWVSSLTIYCSRNVRKKVQTVSASLNAHISIFVGSSVITHEEYNGIVRSYRPDVKEMPSDLVEMVAKTYQIILDCACTDLGKNSEI